MTVEGLQACADALDPGVLDYLLMVVKYEPEAEGMAVYSEDSQEEYGRDCQLPAPPHLIPLSFFFSLIIASR